jgi:alpha-glucosidase
MLSLTRALLRLRRARPALHRGAYRTVAAVPEGVFAYERRHEGDRVLIVLNLERRAIEVALPEPALALLASTHAAARLAAPSALALRPNEGVVLELGR